MKKINYLLLCIILVLASGCQKKTQEIVESSDTKVETYETEPEYDLVENVETEAPVNDFDLLLDDLKMVFPGTAGSSLKVLYANCRLLNICKAKLPFDKMAEMWFKLQDEEDYANMNESFNFLLESLQHLRESDIEKTMTENGIEDFVAVWDDATFDRAESVLYAIINLLP